MRILNKILLTGAVVGLTGCGTTQHKPEKANTPVANYTYNDKDSKGLNLLKYANVSRVEDFKDVKVSAKEIKKGTTGLDVGVKTVAVGATTGAILGLSSAVNVAELFTGGFIIGAGNRSSSMRTQYTLMFIPESLAKNKKEASELIVKSLSNAVIKTINDRPLKEVHHKHLFGKDTYQKLDIPQCQKHKRDCNLVTDTSKGYYQDPSKIALTLVPKPDFLEGNSQKIWVGSLENYYPSFGVCRSRDKECEKQNEKDKKTLLSNLPSWMYGYTMYFPNKVPTLTQFGLMTQMPLVVIEQ
jgi:hypothetical protein